MHLSFARFLAFTKWLYYRLYDSQFFYIDYWSFVHIISGFMLVVILLALNLKYKKTIFISLIVLWEVVEVLFKYFALNIFRPETIKDQINDIVIGLLAGYITYLFIKYGAAIFSKNHISTQLLSNFFTALILGFLWAGTYQSQKSIEIFNATGLNFLNFLFWTLLIALFIFALFFLNRYLKKSWISFSIVSLLYYFCLFTINIISQNAEINTSPSNLSLMFLFSYIHDNQIIKIGFIIAPFIIISHFLMLNWMLKKIHLQSSAN